MSDNKPNQLSMDFSGVGGLSSPDPEKRIQHLSRAYENIRQLCVSANADNERIRPLYDAAVKALADKSNTTDWVELATIRVTREFAKGIVKRCEDFPEQQCGRIQKMQEISAELETLGYVLVMSDGFTVPGGC